MSQNVLNFGIYSAKIFQVLYDSFPIPKSLNVDEMISGCLALNRQNKLQKLRMQRDFADLAAYAGSDEIKMQAQDKLPGLKIAVGELEAQDRADKDAQVAIYKGTLDFLISEVLIRECVGGRLQLTSKGFSNLNKRIIGDNRGPQYNNRGQTTVFDNKKNRASLLSASLKAAPVF